MTVLDLEDLAPTPTPPARTRCSVRLESFGRLTAISRLGGQGRVHRPARTPETLGPAPVVVKLYRRAPPAAAGRVLSEMVSWTWALEAEQIALLTRQTAWPLALVTSGGGPVGIVMRDVSERFAVPFAMPSGRQDRVLLTLEHLLGADSFLQMRGLPVRLDTATRTRVAERVSAALAFLHRHAIVVSDIAPSNLLVSFDPGEAGICFIDCDSMVFRGHQALPSVETGDWNVPADFLEPARSRATDAYKLGLIVLRLFSRSHNAREAEPHLRHVPAELRLLLRRSLGPDAANRPPAGEWQRALRDVVAYERLNERYPGPAPSTTTASQPRAVATAHVTPAHKRPVPPVAPRGGGAGSSPRLPSGGPATTFAPPGRRTTASRAAPTWLGRTVVVLWILVGTIVLFLVLSRLFAGEIPVQAGGGNGSGSAVGGPGLYRYYGPSGGIGQGGGAGAQGP